MSTAHVIITLASATANAVLLVLWTHTRAALADRDRHIRALIGDLSRITHDNRDCVRRDPKTGRYLKKGR